jgi:hypothetical protein
LIIKKEKKMTDGNKPANTEAKTNDAINDLVGG